MRVFVALIISTASWAQPLPKSRIDAVCRSVNSAAWIAPDRIAIDCHVNPSLSYYIVMDAGSGRELSRTPGIRFTRSPDGAHLAHIGQLVHFAPPSAKSYTLVLDGQIIYPPGPTPEYRERDIHEFLDFKWSPDSRRIALLDRLFDWKPDTPGSMTGKEFNVRLVLVVVSAGKVDLRMPLSTTLPPTIEWISPSRLRLTQAATSREININ